MGLESMISRSLENFMFYHRNACHRRNQVLLLMQIQLYLKIDTSSWLVHLFRKLQLAICYSKCDMLFKMKFKSGHQQALIELPYFIYGPDKEILSGWCFVTLGMKRAIPSYSYSALHQRIYGNLPFLFNTSSTPFCAIF